MMRTPSKVMLVSSSPGRAEKLPAPLLASLLRGKGGSRSRGRSSSSLPRSSPMFVARRRSASSVDIQEEKEPSSPKVTCIGQVRISKRKSSSSSSSRSKQQQKQGRCLPQGCLCLQRGFFCNPFSKKLSVKLRPSSASSPAYRHHPSRGWRGWFLLPRSGCYRLSKSQRPQQPQLLNEDAPRVPAAALAAKTGSDDEGDRSEQEEDVVEDEEEETKVFVPTTPPKNALLLMRCRSAPHRAARVPDRCWASSPNAGEDHGAADTAATVIRGMEASHRENRGEEPVFNNDRVANYGSGVTINDGHDESREGEEEDGEAAVVGPSPSFSSRPLILTRCKSEPARKAANLAAAEASYYFWNSGSSICNQVNSTKSKNNRGWSTLQGEAFRVDSQ